MRETFVRLAVLLVLGVADTYPGGAAVDIPARCRPARLERITIDRAAGRARVVLRADALDAVDPPAEGLAVRLSATPEADPAGDLLDETIAAGDGWASTGTAIRYRRPPGRDGSIARVLLRRAARGATTLRVDADGLRVPAVPLTRLAAAVGADGRCLRTCPGRCRRRAARIACRAGRAAARCGFMSGCEPLGARAGEGPAQCLVPYPSNAFLVAAPSTPTGFRLRYPRRAMPTNRDGVPIDPTAWATLDGFSPGAVLVAHFPEGVDLAASRVPPLDDPEASLAPDSPTLLVEADTPGCVRIPHFAENDVGPGADGAAVAPPRQAFLIRPQRRLRNATRYIVALRGLVAPGGAAVRAPEGFAAAARRRGRGGSTALDGERRRVAGILDTLERDCGVDRARVVLAWDFTTASDRALQRWLLHMRDETFRLLGDGFPPFTIDEVEADPLGDPRICRRVRGRVSLPRWTEADGPGARLVFDAAGDLPVPVGTASVPFTALVPCTLLNAPGRRGRVVVYGHGLLGAGDTELSNALDLRSLADRYGFMLIAADWQGMSRADLPVILRFLPDLSGFPVLPERLHQGILNQLVLARLARAAGALPNAPAFQGPGGHPIVDPQAVYFYGNSMGAIYGATLLTLTPDITRGVLGVGAANFSTLLERSNAFAPFGAALRATYPDDLERALVYPVLQQLWDRVDPNGWYHRLLDDPLPATPRHTVLFHLATNDAEVPPLGMEIMARSLGIPQLAPVVRHRWGIAEVTAPYDGSVLVESDGGYPDTPRTNTAPPPNAGHEGLRALPAMQAQIDAFLRPDGRVEQFCTGPCDPE